MMSKGWLLHLRCTVPLKVVMLPILTMLCLHVALAQQVVSGFIYLDDNKNGKKEKNERGISHVGVTNGVDVVETDARGYYELPRYADMIVSVIKPSGYQFALDEHKNPHFYYIHKPIGSVTKEYKGSTPTGDIPASLDFALYPKEESDTFRFLVFGDPQMSHPEDIYYFRRGIVSELLGIEEVAFGLTLGDIVGNKLEGIPPYKEAVARIGVPWYNVLGNHDMNFDVDDDQNSDETFESLFGPTNYAFNYGICHVVVLDNVMSPYPEKVTNYTVGMREDQWRFLENNLKLVPKDRLLILAAHIPFWTLDTDSRKKMYSLLEGYENILLLSAHTHVQQQHFHGVDDGWYGMNDIHEYNVGTTCGDWYSGELDQHGVPEALMQDGTPKGYTFIHIKGDTYHIDYKAAGKPQDYQVEIFAPKVVRRGRGAYGFYANFFMGSQRDTVSYRIDGGEWKDMAFTPVQDPNFITKYYQWDLSEILPSGKRPFSRPQKSTHLWFARFPTTLGAGEHHVEVRALDMFGRYHYADRYFRVEEPSKEAIMDDVKAR